MSEAVAFVVVSCFGFTVSVRLPHGCSKQFNSRYKGGFFLSDKWFCTHCQTIRNFEDIEGKPTCSCCHKSNTEVSVAVRTRAQKKYRFRKGKRLNVKDWTGEQTAEFAGEILGRFKDSDLEIKSVEAGIGKRIVKDKYGRFLVAKDTVMVIAGDSSTASRTAKKEAT